MNLDAFKGLVADLARPFSIFATSGAAAAATVLIALQVKTFGEGAVFIGAVYAGLGALYWGKAWEQERQSKHTAEVEKERAKASPPPKKALAPADAPEAEEPDPTMFGGPR